MTTVSSLSKEEVVNGTFVTDDNVLFTVISGEHYPQSAIARQHQKYCLGLREGLLVSLSFRGKPVPVVKVSDGVVRITAILLCELEVDVDESSSEISRVLGVSETRQPIGLYLP